MIRVGLTGPIAAGKSTVGEEFLKAGFAVLDADRVVHSLYNENGELTRAVLTAFPEAADSGGGIDRARLGEIVFRDRGRLEHLERLVHPYVVDWITAWFASRKGAPVAVVEAALWGRVHSKGLLDLLITVRAPRRMRKERLLRKGLSSEEAESRLEAQGEAPAEDVESSWVIQNNGTTADLRIEAVKLVDRLRDLAGA